VKRGGIGGESATAALLQRHVVYGAVSAPHRVWPELKCALLRSVNTSQKIVEHVEVALFAAYDEHPGLGRKAATILEYMRKRGTNERKNWFEFGDAILATWAEVTTNRLVVCESIFRKASVCMRFRMCVRVCMCTCLCVYMFV